VKHCTSPPGYVALKVVSLTRAAATARVIFGIDEYSIPIRVLVALEHGWSVIILRIYWAQG